MKEDAQMREAENKEYASSHYIDSSLTPNPPLLSKAEAQERAQPRRDRAHEGYFDADTHIVDPQAHYAYIDYLEESVTFSSEFYKCRGIYRDGDDDLRGWYKQRNTFDFVPAWMWDFLPGELVQPSPKIDSHYLTLRSLWKSYLIVCHVIKSFNDLSKAGFCTDFYSMLVEHPEKDVAELVKIKTTQLRKLKAEVEVLISYVFKSASDTSSESQSIVFTKTLVAKKELLDALHLSQHQKSNSMSVTHSLLMCRIIVLLLDLGLVSYVGSHGSRFGTYIKSNTDSSGFQHNISASSYGFTCSLMPLACLDGFLDTQVWIFRSNENTAGSPQQRLSILTSNDLFADIWGPVWAFPAGYGAKDRICGYICPEGG